MSDCASIESIVFQAMLIFTALGCLSAIYFGFIICWCKQRTSGISTSKVIQNTTLIKIVSFVAFTSYYTSGIQFTVSSCFDLSKTNCNGGGGFETNLLGFYILLIVFSLRIVKTFENTVYAFNQTQTKCLAISLIIPVIIFCAALALSVIYINDERSIEVVSVLSTVFMVIIVGICIGLLRLFIVKLTQVINDFLKEFGTLSPQQLFELNKSLRFVHFNFCIQKKKTTKNKKQKCYSSKPIHFSLKNFELVATHREWHRLTFFFDVAHQ